MRRVLFSCLFSTGNKEHGGRSIVVVEAVFCIETIGSLSHRETVVNVLNGLKLNEVVKEAIKSADLKVIRRSKNKLLIKNSDDTCKGEQQSRRRRRRHGWQQFFGSFMIITTVITTFLV